MKGLKGKKKVMEKGNGNSGKREGWGVGKVGRGKGESGKGGKEREWEGRERDR